MGAAMGSNVISPRKIAQYRRLTGLDILAAYTDGHEKKLYLSNGRIAWLKMPTLVTFNEERWDARMTEGDVLADYNEMYLWKMKQSLEAIAKHEGKTP
jgi:chromosome condensin MukBEF complex kleisin-like MukF subunit